MRKPAVTVIVEPAERRKGFRWRQVGRTGATGAMSPKTYDTKALAKRAGQRQVDVLNGAINRLPADVVQRLAPDEMAAIDVEYAVLRVLE